MAYDEAVRSITMLADSSIGIFTGPPGVTGSLVPNGGKQFTFVKVVAGIQKAGLCTNASNEIALGVLQNKPQGVGQAATVAISGVSLVVAGATFTGGEPVKSSSTGTAAVATPGTDVVLGVATTAGVAGELISVALRVN
jgi:hypothetical protein